MNIREEEEESKTGLAGLESGSKRNGANVFQTVGLHAWQIHNLPKYILNFDCTGWLMSIRTSMCTKQPPPSLSFTPNVGDTKLTAVPIDKSFGQTVRESALAIQV